MNKHCISLYFEISRNKIPCWRTTSCSKLVVTAKTPHKIYVSRYSPICILNTSTLLSLNEILAGFVLINGLKHFQLNPTKHYRRLQLPGTDDQAPRTTSFPYKQITAYLYACFSSTKKKTRAQCNRINFHECQRVRWSITLREGFPLLIFWWHRTPCRPCHNGTQCSTCVKSHLGTPQPQSLNRVSESNARRIV
jgi:hypothetical protein